MASIVTVSGATPESSQLLNAVNNIRAGIGMLQALRGRSTQCIAVSQAKYQAVFGTDTTGSAQALHDRLENLLTAYEGGTLTTLSDLIDALLST
jgi:hypothetical protein